MKSIKSRLIISILTITIIPVVAFLVYSLIFVSDDQIQSNLDENRTKIAWAAQHLKTQTGQLRDVLYSLHLEEGLLANIADESASSTNIENVLRNALYANSNIVSRITVVSSTGQRVASIDYERGFTRRTYADDHAYRVLQGTPTGIAYASVNDHLVVYQTIHDFKTQAELGLIVMELNRNFIREFTSIFGADTAFVIFSSQSVVVSHLDVSSERVARIRHERLDDRLIDTLTLDQHVIWSSRVPNQDIYIASLVPERLITGLNNRLITIGFVIIVISLSMAIPTALFLSNRITNPIIKLVNHMNTFEFSHVQGGFQRYDELKLLERSYNKMIDEMTTMIRERYKNKIAMQRAQLKALQAQINPHFLANTFQMIGGMALSTDAPHIYDATIKMSNIVRYSLKMSQKATTLREEVHHIDDYLSIQKLRFGDALIFKIDIPDHVLDCRIPKLTLQPIIENSFKHGAALKLDALTITIDCTITDIVQIKIADDGIGIQAERLATLNEQFSQTRALSITEEDSDEAGIGLANIDARIKLLHGSRFGLTMAHHAQGGTTTILRLPKEGLKDETVNRRR